MDLQEVGRKADNDLLVSQKQGNFYSVEQASSSQEEMKNMQLIFMNLDIAQCPHTIFWFYGRN
jgi:hypothetical protein